MSRTFFAALAVAAILGAASAAPLSAQVITFETTPFGAASTDDYSIGLSDAYAVGPLSITFGFDTDLDGVPDTPAVIEQISADGTDGFVACGGLDIASAGYAAQLGNFFMRGRPGGGFGRLVIDYSGGVVSGASGEIWDIDGLTNGTEQYRLRAFDSIGTLLAVIDSPVSTQDSGCPNTEFDGRPWTFSFAGVPGIARITVEFIGTKTNGVGLAFNNFNATGDQPVPAGKPSWGRLKSRYR